MNILEQSATVTLLIGPFIDDTDGKTAEEGLTLAQADVRLSKNAGNMAQKNEGTSCTHDELGYYTCPLDTTDTATLGYLKVMVHQSGSLSVWHDYMVVPSNVYDSIVLGIDDLEVDAIAISGSTAAADDLEASALTIVSSTALTGTLSTTQMTTNLTEITDDHYNGRIVIWTDNNLQDQASNITDYDGSSKMLTYTAVTEAPTNGDGFIIV